MHVNTYLVMLFVFLLKAFYIQENVSHLYIDPHTDMLVMLQY